MKYLPLVFRNLRRHWIRTTFTFGAVLVVFMLYGFLMVVRAAFSVGVDFAGVDRLWTMHKVSIIEFLPVSYMDDIASMPGVKMVTDCTWFGGVYQNNPIQFAFIATDVDTYLKLYPDFHVPAAQLKALDADRQGLIVGRDTANRYGWKIGDRVPIQATIWMPTEGLTWYFNVDGIYDGDATVDKTQALFRYDYLDENRLRGKGQVSWYVVRIDNPDRAADIAAAIDAHFANSPAETKTAPEKAVFADFAKQTGNIGEMITAIVAVALVMILLIVGNTMAQAVRERTSELAVLKTLGFSNTLVLVLVLAESLVLAVVAGAAGLGLVWLLVQRGGVASAFLPVFVFKNGDIALGAALCVLLGVGAGALPALAAMRLRITDALRRA